MVDGPIERKTDPGVARTGFDLFAAASEFYDKFPAFLDRVTFIDLSAGSVINSNPDKVQQVIDLIGNSETGKKELQPIIAKCRQNKTSYSWPDGQGNHIVFIYSGDDRPRFFGGTVTPARELQFIFDHETGHVVVPEGGDKNRLKAENAADAYALICDLQRNGADSELPATLLLFRASFALFNQSGIINFSAPLAEKIIEYRKDIVAGNFTPEKSVELAGSLATIFTLPLHTAQDFSDSLKSLHKDFSFDALRDIVLETPMLETFKWTSTVLKAALDRRLTLPYTPTTDFNETAQKLRAEMNAREKEFAAKPPKITTAPPPAP